MSELVPVLVCSLSDSGEGCSRLRAVAGLGLQSDIIGWPQLDRRLGLGVPYVSVATEL